MPSIGHAVVGLAAARWWTRCGGSRGRAAAAFVALATFPDLDVLARALGAGARSPWLHRGITHAVLMSALAGLAAGLALERDGRARARAAAFGAFVAASHGLLDTLTRGGNGVMLLWPWSTARWLASVALVPASPMGLHVASARAAAVAAQELVLLAPLLIYALWPGRGRARGAGSATASAAE